jgi:hypothetical protein
LRLTEEEAGAETEAEARSTGEEEELVVVTSEGEAFKD